VELAPANLFYFTNSFTFVLDADGTALSGGVGGHCVFGLEDIGFRQLERGRYVERKLLERQGEARKQCVK
jgi:hypothetical protein